MGRETVELPKSEPTPIGLINALGGEDNTSEGGWLQGISYWPEPCTYDPTIQVVCDPTEIDFTTLPGGVDFDTFVITEGIEVETVRARDRGYVVDLAARRMRNISSEQIETALWSGLSLFPNNPSFDDASSVAGGPTSLIDGLGALQDYIARNHHSRGMIHAAVNTVSWWRSLGLVEVDGSKLRDVYGNLIVPGTGYPRPDGTDHFAAATGPMSLYLSPIDVTEPYLDPSINKHTSTANRSAAAVWTCGAAIVTMDSSSLVGADVPLLPPAGAPP